MSTQIQSSTGIFAATVLLHLWLATPATAQASATLLQKSNLVYQGAFRVPETDFSFGGTAIAYDSADNSLWVTSHDQLTAEISIPTLVNSSDMNQLKTATFLQNFTDITEGGLPNINPGDPNAKDIGGYLPYNGKIIVTGWTYYDANATQVLSHFVSSPNLALTGDITGPYQLGTMGAGFVSGYMTLVPPAWRDSLGGPAITGQCCIPIISRTSWGPAAFTFDPVDLGVKNPVPVNPLVYYSTAHPTLGVFGTAGIDTLFNGCSQVNGVVFPNGSRTILFIGSNGVGDFCYGIGGVDCNDPADASKGDHAYPYVYQIWAYDAMDFTRVHEGKMQPWEITPNAVWTFDLPFESDDKHLIGGAAYDPATQRIFISQMKADPGTGYFDGPIFHVFKVNLNTASIGKDSPSSQIGPLRMRMDQMDKVVRFSPGAGREFPTRLTIRSISGTRIAELTPGAQGIFTWNVSGNAPGMYLVRANYSDRIQTQVVTLMK